MRVERDERVLVTPSQEDGGWLTDFLESTECACAICTRTSTPCAASNCSHGLRAGVYDCSSASTCLREGLDLPEFSLVAILSTPTRRASAQPAPPSSRRSAVPRETSGRGAMYADKVTDSMRNAIDETERRRARSRSRTTRARHRPAAAAEEDRRHHRGSQPRRDGHKKLLARNDKAGKGKSPRPRCVARGRGRGAGPARIDHRRPHQQMLAAAANSSSSWRASARRGAGHEEGASCDGAGRARLSRGSDRWTARHPDHPRSAGSRPCDHLLRGVGWQAHTDVRR